MGSYEERKRKLFEENGVPVNSSVKVSTASNYEERKRKLFEGNGIASSGAVPPASQGLSSIAQNKERMQSVMGGVGTALKAAGNAISPMVGNNGYKTYQSRIRAAENAVRAAQAQEAMNPNIHGNIGYNFKGADTAKAQADLRKIKGEYTQFKTDKFFEKQDKKLSDIYNKAENDPDFIKMVRAGSDIYHRAEEAKKDNGFRITFNAKADGGLGEMFKLNNLTPQERNTYFYLLGKEGQKAADEYEKLMERTVNERVAQNTYDYIKGVSRDNKAAGVGLNTVASLMGGAGLANTVGGSIGNAIRPDEGYIPADRYTPAYSANLIQKAAMEGVTGDIESPLGKFFAETGLSTANFLTSLAAGGGGATTLALMGSNAGGQSAYDALERGATAEQAAKVGLMSAAAEMAFERIPVGTASELFSGRFKDSFGKAMLQMAMEEGFEEVATEYTNLLGDNIIMGDKSEFNRFVKDLEAQGISPEEATKAAILEFAVKRPAMAFAGGAVSGAGIGAAGGAYGGTNNTGNRTNTVPNDFFDNEIVSAIMESNNVSETEARQILNNVLNEGSAVSENATVENEETDYIPPYLRWLFEEEEVESGTVNENLTVGDEEKPEPVRVGRVRVLENPYDGPTPIVDNNVQRYRVSIPLEAIDNANDIITGSSNKMGGIRKAYIAVLNRMKGDNKHVTAKVKGLKFGGYDYEVMISNKVVGELLNYAPKAETFAIIESLPDIVQEGEYVGSSKYDQHRTKNENTIRYDYFETPIEIGGENYIVAFDVAVQPDKNRYKTHRVINEISLTKDGVGLVNPISTADPALSGFDNSISENWGNINTFSAENAGNVIGNNESARRRNAAVHAQFDRDVRASGYENAYNEEIARRVLESERGEAALAEEQAREAERIAEEQRQRLLYAERALNANYGINPMNGLRTDNAQRLQLGQNLTRAEREYNAVSNQWGLSDAEQGTLNYVISQTMAARNAANGDFDSLSYAKDLLSSLPGFDYANRYRLETELLPAAVRYHELRTDYNRQSGFLKEGAQGMARQAAEMFDGADDKKTGIAYKVNTAERNFEDVFEKSNPAAAKWFIENYTKPVHDNNADMQDFKNAEYKGLRDLGIDTGKKKLFRVTFTNQAGDLITADLNEDGITQVYGEKLISDADLEALKDNKGNAIDADKIRNAVNWISAEYKKLLDSVNLVLMEYGYDPVPERQNYFPHWSEEELTGFKGALSKLGIDFSERELPTSIAGRTEDFRPGKRWVGNFLQRKGEQTSYGAVQGMQKYIEPVADVLYHTGDIQRFRALENALRHRYSEEGVNEAYESIGRRVRDGEITFDDGQREIKDLQDANPLTRMNNFAKWLREYTNLLAGKNARVDRVIEDELNRKSLSILNSVSNQFARNVLGFNTSAPFTNFIPFTQADISAKNKMRGAMDTIQNVGNDDGLMEKSTFYRNRRNVKPAYRAGLDRFVDKSMFLMETIDLFTVESLIRGRYYDNIAKGMDSASAMADADDHAARVVADRSKGALPVVFQTKNPFMRMLTMFQVEVNNQFGYMLKDIPRANRDKAVGAVIAALAKVFIGAFAFNEMFEKVLGRRPAFDPIDIMTAAIGRFSGWERNNLFDVMGGEDMIYDKPMSKKEALWETLTDIGEEVPFAGSLLGGGRIPVSDALPNVKTIIDNAMDAAAGDTAQEKASEKIRKEVMKPLYYLLPPAGGIALKKTNEGLMEARRGGSYVYNNKGEEILRYPVENASIGDYIKAGIWGRTSSEGYKTWKKYGFKNLTAEETANYPKIVKAGISYDQFMKYKYVFSTTEATKEEKAQLIKNDKDLSVKQKNALSEVLLNTDSFNPDYSKSGEAFDVSLMSGAQQKAYKAIYTKENDIRGLDEFKEIYNVLQGSGDKYKNMNLKKEDKINILINDFDYTEAGAEALWKDFQDRNKDGD